MCSQSWWKSNCNNLHTFRPYCSFVQVYPQFLSGFDRGRPKWGWIFSTSWGNSPLVSRQNTIRSMAFSAQNCPAVLMSGTRMTSVVWRKSMLVMLLQKHKFWQTSAPVNWPSIAEGELVGLRKPAAWSKDCWSPCGNWLTPLVYAWSTLRGWHVCGRCNRSIWHASKIHLVLNCTRNSAQGHKRETRSWMSWDVAEGHLLWEAFIATSAPLSRVSRNYIWHDSYPLQVCYWISRVSSFREKIAHIGKCVPSLNMQLIFP